MSTQQGGGEERLEIVGRYDGARLQAGGLEDQHHLGFSAAFEDARRQMEEDSRWHGAEVRLRMEVSITSNPGAVGEYRVHAVTP